MAQVAIDQYLKLIPAVRYAPQKYLWSSYDAEADVLYINFKKDHYLILSIFRRDGLDAIARSWVG